MTQVTRYLLPYNFEVLVLCKKEQMDILRHLLEITDTDAKDFLLIDLWPQISFTFQQKLHKTKDGLHFVVKMNIQKRFSIIQ